MDSGSFFDLQPIMLLLSWSHDEKQNLWCYAQLILLLFLLLCSFWSLMSLLLLLERTLMKHRKMMCLKKLIKESLTKSQIKLSLNPSRLDGVCRFSQMCYKNMCLEVYFGDGLQMNVVDGEL